MHPLIQYFSNQRVLGPKSIDVTYTAFRECETEPDHCSIVCRCRKIIDVKIRAIHLNSLIDEIFVQCYPKAREMSPEAVVELRTLMYCLDRLLRHHKAYSAENWTYRIEPGYYGEEFMGCSIQQSIRDQLIVDLNTILPLSPENQIRWVLRQEYGYLLPILENCTFRYRLIPRDRIKYGSQNQYTRAITENLDHYRDYPLPRCICRQETDGTYWIVDGYHRFLATLPGSDKIKVYLIVPPSTTPVLPQEPKPQPQEIKTA